MTQSELAKRSGMALATVKAIRYGKQNNPGLIFIEAWAEAVGLELILRRKQ